MYGNQILSEIIHFNFMKVLIIRKQYYITQDTS